MVEAAKKCCPTHGWQTGAAVEKQVINAWCYSSVKLHWILDNPCDQSCVCLVIQWSLLWWVQRAREIVRINFGAEQINELLGGGLESKAITEMFGEYRYCFDHAAPLSLLSTEASPTAAAAVFQMCVNLKGVVAVWRWGLFLNHLSPSLPVLRPSIVLQDWQDSVLPYPLCDYTDGY